MARDRLFTTGQKVARFDGRRWHWTEVWKVGHRSIWVSECGDQFSKRTGVQFGYADTVLMSISQPRVEIITKEEMDRRNAVLDFNVHRQYLIHRLQVPSGAVDRLTMQDAKRLYKAVKAIRVAVFRLSGTGLAGDKEKP